MIRESRRQGEETHNQDSNTQMEVETDANGTQIRTRGKPRIIDTQILVHPHPQGKNANMTGG